jgi:hypothetical protein
LRPAGETFVLFNKAVVQPNLQPAQQALVQTWRIGPATRDPADPAYKELSFDPALLPLRPLPPVQLRARRDASGITLSWIRQTRTDGDIWETAEVPLAESSESYVLDIMNGAIIARSLTRSTPGYIYSNADIITDFGSIPATLTFRVAQVSSAIGTGTSAQRTFNV